MKEGQYSRTAAGAAALRANHFLFTKNPVFTDPYAYHFTSAGWKKLLNQPVVVKFLNSKPMSVRLGLLTGQVVGRARYAEDALKQAIAKGTRQYVIVGAGLDSFVMREAQKYPDLHIFEIDHPDTQAEKQRKLCELGDISPNVHLVAVNFEKESIADALAKSAYQRNQPAFFSWLGTTHYLAPQTTLATLQSIAQYAASGSEVVLDYSIHYQELQGIERLGVMALSKFTQYLKEPLMGNFKVKALHDAVQQLGYVVLEDLSGEGINQRYFAGRDDRILQTTATHMLHLKNVK